MGQPKAAEDWRRVAVRVEGEIAVVAVQQGGLAREGAAAAEPARRRRRRLGSLGELSVLELAVSAARPRGRGAGEFAVLLVAGELADGGSLDAMVACGVVLVEGIGRDESDEDVAEGLAFLRAAHAKGHAHAMYEIGCLHYLGSYPQLVPEDMAKACTPSPIEPPT